MTDTATIDLATSFQIRIKYALDRVGAGLFLIAGAPLFALIALVIKWEDGGTIFFRQKRIGLGAQFFMIWKFRTMVPNADQLLDAQGHIGHVNRITKVGSRLRKWGLDELPQLINILKGEMSFVGPRPVLPAHLSRYTSEQLQRFRMRPGITGLAQINGRNQLKWSKRIVFDVAYINRYSLGLDLYILFKTIRVVLFREGFMPDRNPEQVDDLGHTPTD